MNHVLPRGWVACVVALVAGCGGGATVDAGGIDGGSVDAQHADAPVTDTGTSTDAPPADMPATDATTGDAGCPVPDSDGDGHASIACGGDDCNDSDPNAYPGAAETCDTGGHDEDCNPATLGPDHDGDGFPATGCCNRQPDGSVLCGSDCDDTSHDVSPSAPEVCDGIDDNCNGTIDEGVSQVFYRDCDGDGFGDATDSGMSGCVASDFAACFAHPRVTNHTDCDDTNASVSPSAPEVCDAAMADENCDGMHNEGCTCVAGSTVPCGSALPGCSMGTQTCTGMGYGMCSVTNTIVTCYTDADNDTFAPASATTSSACACPMGTTSTQPTDASNTDCNDTSSAAHPGGTEICDGLDNNCNGTIDEGVGSTYYRDADGDTYGNPAMPVVACAMPGGTAANNLDCNDASAAIHPGAAETCNCIDDNCSGAADEGLTSVRYRDADGDTYGNASMPLTICTASGMTCSGGSSAGYVVPSTDCDDGDARAHPGAMLCQSTPRADGTFDFNCDGASTPCRPYGTTCPSARYADCTTVTIWTHGVTPPCGGSDTAVTCASSGLGYCFSSGTTGGPFIEQCD